MKESIFAGIGLILFILGCSRGEAPTQVTPIESRVIELENPKAAWQMKWDSTLSKAKKEGKVVVIASMNSPQRIEVIKRFKEKFGFDAEITTGRGAELIARTMTERRAGIYVVDLYTEGPNDILHVLKPAGVLEVLDKWLILPEVADEKQWNGPLHFDKAHMMVGGLEAVTTPITINTNLVKPEEIKAIMTF